MLSLLALALFALAALGGCSDDTATPTPTPDNSGTNNNNTNGENNGGPTECSTTADCEAEGLICIGTLCRECISDEVCEGEIEYGVGATCGGGTCTDCKGDDGCACGDGDACEGDLVCTAGVCGACPQGDLSCACYSNSTCNPGLRCDTDSTTCVDCPAGQDGCACDGGDCDGDLECMNDVCTDVPCVAGADGCPCDADDTCEDGLTCTGDGMCAPCTNEFVDCPCDNDACANDLVCNTDEDLCREAVICEDAGCIDNQLCEKEDGVDAVCLDDCASGFAWNAETSMCDVVIVANCDDGAEGSILADCVALNRACDDSGDAAVCGACSVGFVQDEANADACRAVATCTDLDCAASNRECSGGMTSDAACGACLMGFSESNNVCVMDNDSNCVDGDPDSILAECTGQDRACTDTGAGAFCGDCLTDYIEDPNTTVCVLRVDCEDLDCTERNRACIGDDGFKDCGDCIEGTFEDPDDDTVCREPLGCDVVRADCQSGEYCVEGADGQDAQCLGWPCADINGDPDITRIYSDTEGECVTCTTACGEEGEVRVDHDDNPDTPNVGIPHPFALQGGTECICQTENGYFYDNGGSEGAVACDADGDGWVRDSAKSKIESDDPALAENARCDLRTIDRIILKNEWGQEREIVLCNQDGSDGVPFRPLDAGGECAESNPISLYETQRNDDVITYSAVLDSISNTFGIYTDGTRGRRPQVEEINGLTKFCFDEIGDFNDNNVSDVLEWHGQETNGMTAEESIFSSFTFFAETHRGYWRERVGLAADAYIIEERSRCESDFPIKYDATVDTMDYWKSCTRGRDTDFDLDSGDAQIGFDFGGFTCDTTQGGCPLPTPVTEMSAADEIPPHGLCEITTPIAADEPWRGMTHHSQFKCVVVDANPPADPDNNPHIVLPDELADGGDTRLQYNRCSINCPDGDLDCGTDCDGDTCLSSSTPASGDDANPATPNFTCEAIDGGSVTSDDVGFVAIRQAGAGNYTNGCLDEWGEWKYLCPGYDQDTCEDEFGNFLSTSCRVAGQSHPTDFGRVICGCGFNYGGGACDVGCADSANNNTYNVHYGGDPTNTDGVCINGYCPISNTGSRQGYWLCGDFTTTAYTTGDPATGQYSTSADNSIRVRGGVPSVGFSKEPLGDYCGSTDADGNCQPSGWTVR